MNVNIIIGMQCNLLKIVVQFNKNPNYNKDRWIKDYSL